MNRADSGGREGAPQLDAGLREIAVNSVLRWRHRVEHAQLAAAHAQVGPSTAAEIARIAQEASQLRTLATARGVASLNPYLESIQGAEGIGATASAVLRFAAYLGIGGSGERVVAADPAQGYAATAAAPHAMPVPVAPAPQAKPVDAAPQAKPVDAAPQAMAPVATSPTAAEPDGIAPPPLLGKSIIGHSIFEPPMLDATAARRPAAPRTVASLQRPPVANAPAERAAASATLASLQSRPLAVSAEPPRPPELSVEPPRPSEIGASVRLPDSLPPAKQPEYAKTFLGFRAFGGSARAPLAGPAPAAHPDGVLGLAARAARHARAPEDAPPAARHAAPEAIERERRAASPRARAKRTSSPRSDRPPRSALPVWAYASAGAVALLGIATVLVIELSGRPAKRPPPPLHDTAAGTSSHAGPILPPSSAAANDEQPERIMSRVHEYGKETPELRALLDMQSKLALACKGDPASCGRGWTPLARDAFTPLERSTIALTPAPDTPLPAWLQHLKLPADLPVRDEPALRAMFDLNTKNIAGRQRFQAKLFECAAYDDIFDSTLVKYGAPSWLSAVVYQESACNPRATSDVGAKGLWQFMPESARAYGLRVVDGEVDERLNPIKSTEAAIHFLTDMQRKIGNWDLVLAAYNMGPLAVLARLEQTGGKAGFWDMAHAGLLPEETAGYVPAIEAYALALQNLSRLQFSRDGKRLESTAEVVVKPGTRLSLIARAASTTTLHIRELNPEFLRDVVPEGETSARVPDAEAHRAQAFLESWSPDDDRDTCVPEDFDWGAKQFDSSRFAKGCPQAAASH